MKILSPCVPDTIPGLAQSRIGDIEYKALRIPCYQEYKFMASKDGWALLVKLKDPKHPEYQEAKKDYYMVKESEGDECE